VCDRLRFDDLFEMRIFGVLCPQEFPSSREIVKQGAYFDLGAGRFATVLNADDFSSVDDDFGSGEGIRFAGCESKFGDARDTWDCFPSKAESVDRGEVLLRFDFRGRVSFEAHQGVVSIHPAAVIGYADQCDAAALDAYLDVGGTGVDAVFDELFCDRGRALDNFTSGNLAGEGFG